MFWGDVTFIVIWCPHVLRGAFAADEGNTYGWQDRRHSTTYPSTILSKHGVQRQGLQLSAGVGCTLGCVAGGGFEAGDTQSMSMRREEPRQGPRLVVFSGGTAFNNVAGEDALSDCDWYFDREIDAMDEGCVVRVAGFRRWRKHG